MPDADAEDGPPARAERADRPVQAVVADRPHARAEVPDPGDHQRVGGRDLRRRRR